MNQSKLNILILDYSTDRFEAPLIEQWLPAAAQITSLGIDTEPSFPLDLIERKFTHVIHSGSTLSINHTSPFTSRAVNFIRQLRDRAVPQMGICYGHQLLNLALVGPHAVQASPNGFDVGWNKVHFNSQCPITGVSPTETVWQHHFDEVIELPPDSIIIATNQHTPIQAFINPDQHLFGTQFHPEFNRQQGNQFFLKDRQNIENHNFNVENLIKSGPSLDTGPAFFNFFLNAFNPSKSTAKP